MTHVAAVLPGEAALASHQIILRVFFFLIPFFRSNFADGPDLLAAIREDQVMAARLLKLGVLVGGGIALVAASIPSCFPFLLTHDAVVQASVKQLALPLFLGGLLTAPVAVSEVRGCVIGKARVQIVPCQCTVYVLITLHLSFGLFKLKAGGGPVSSVVRFRCLPNVQSRMLYWETVLTSFDCESRYENWFEECCAPEDIILKMRIQRNGKICFQLVVTGNMTQKRNFTKIAI